MILTTKINIFTQLIIISSIVCYQSKGESVDSEDGELFCYPDAYKNTRKSCECNSISTTPWGLPALNIDCSYRNLKNPDMSEILPLFTQSLDLSWNGLEKVPVFSSDGLSVLNLMHNNISTVLNKNFNKLPNIKELYLNWNSIQTIELHAFEGLAHLQILDLSHNNLQNLDYYLFAPLQMLEFLSLSWNRQLNQTPGLQETEFYSTFNINTRLKTLKLEACSLNRIILNEMAPLQELVLRRNNFMEIPADLPLSLEILDLSHNLMISLNRNETMRIPNVQELYLEDMPELQRVEELSFEPLQKLLKISFQNSRRLTFFHERAVYQPTSLLKTMIFRGTSISTFNETLASLFGSLEKLDFNGMPLHCDCQLAWFNNIGQDTQGRCHRPYRLRGDLIKNVPQSEFKCNRWPRWLYGLIIFALIILCSGGIYLIVIGLRPNRRVTMRPKVGAGSPYARITIEPNQQEHT